MYTWNSLSCGRSKRKEKEISGGREARGGERVIPRAIPIAHIPALPFPLSTPAMQSTSNRQGYLPFLLLVFGISGGRKAREEERVIPRAFPRVHIPAFPFPCLTSATQSTSNRQGYLPFLLLVFGISGGRKAREEERVIPRAFPRVHIPAFPFPCLTSATQSTSNRQGYLPFLLLVFSQRP